MMEGMHRGLRLAASIGTVLAALAADAAETPTAIKGGVPGKWFLAIEGKPAGELVAYQPPKVEPAPTEKPGIGNRQPLTKTGPETASFKLGAATTASVNEWLRVAIAGKGTGTNLQVDAADYNFNILTVTTLESAHVTRIDLPALDAAGKDPGWVQVQVESDRVKMTVPGGGLMARTTAMPAARDPWLTSGYRLTVGKLDSRGVTHIDPLAFRFGKTPAAVAFPDLQFVVEGAAVEAYAKLAATNLKAGAGGVAPTPLEARLEVLSTSGRTVYTIDFQQAYLKKFAEGRGAKGLNATVTLAPTRVTFDTSLR
jgi:hypothetical protein